MHIPRAHKQKQIDCADEEDRNRNKYKDHSWVYVSRPAFCTSEHQLIETTIFTMPFATWRMSATCAHCTKSSNQTIPPVLWRLFSLWAICEWNRPSVATVWNFNVFDRLINYIVKNRIAVRSCWSQVNCIVCSRSQCKLLLTYTKRIDCCHTRWRWCVVDRMCDDMMSTNAQWICEFVWRNRFCRRDCYGSGGKKNRKKLLLNSKSMARTVFVERSVEMKKIKTDFRLPVITQPQSVSMTWLPVCFIRRFACLFIYVFVEVCVCGRAHSKLNLRWQCLMPHMSTYRWQ